MGWEGIFDYYTQHSDTMVSPCHTEMKTTEKKENEKKELEEKIQKKSKEILEKYDVYF